MAGFVPEPWKPEDCLNRMAAFSMTGNAYSELLHAEVVAKIGVGSPGAVHFDPAVKLDPAPKLDFTGLLGSLLRNLEAAIPDHFPAYYVEGSNN